VDELELVLHGEHLESGEEWLARGRRGSRFYIGNHLSRLVHQPGLKGGI
jgi:hypothetical protein